MHKVHWTPKVILAIKRWKPGVILRSAAKSLWLCLTLFNRFKEMAGGLILYLVHLFASMSLFFTFQVFLPNTPPGDKLGLWQRKIYSKLFCWDHNFFHIMICWDHNFFHIMISTSILWFQHPYYDLNIKFLQIMISTANFSKLWSQQCVCLYKYNFLQDKDKGILFLTSAFARISFVFCVDRSL